MLKAIRHDDVTLRAVKQNKVEFVGQSGVFVLLDHDEVVFIGQSQDIVTRILSLRQEGRMAFTHFAVIDCPAEARADFLAHYILEWCPRYNLTIPAQGTFKSAKQLKEVLDTSIHRIKRYAREKRIEERQGYYRVADFADFYSWNNDSR